MKKALIITLVFDNYGTRLQSFALCRVLSRIGVEPHVLKLEPTWGNKGSSISRVRTLKQILKSYGWRSVPKLFDWLLWMIAVRIISMKNENRDILYKERGKLFKSIIARIPYTDDECTCEDLRNGVQVFNDYDYYIVGSDQVWNGIKVGNLDIFMLDFLKTGKKGVAYAASFGMTTFPGKMKNTYEKYINNFSSILVREKEGIEMCRLLGRDDAKLVLDPTLLLSKSDYDEIRSDEEFSETKRYLLVYSLNNSLKIYREAHKLAERNGLRMVVLKRSICPPDISRFKNAEELFAVSPAGFLNLIDGAECIITNSYHALLFAVNFHKPFYLYLDNSDEENSRLTTITDMFGLTANVFMETEPLPHVLPVIDYDKVDVALSSERATSIDLFMKALKNS